jgi:hypothetical protein
MWYSHDITPVQGDGKVVYTRYMAEMANKLLRLPADVLAELTEWAAEDDRSVNSLIVHLLRRALREWRHSERVAA